MGGPLKLNANVVSNLASAVDNLIESPVLNGKRAISDAEGVGKLVAAGLGGLPPYDVLRSSELVARIRFDAADMANARPAVARNPADVATEEEALLRFLARPADVDRQTLIRDARDAAVDGIRARLPAELQGGADDATLGRILTAVLTSRRVKSALGEAVRGVGRLAGETVTGDGLLADAATVARLVLADGFPGGTVGELQLLLDSRTVDAGDPKSMLFAADAFVADVNRRLEEFGGWRQTYDTRKAELERRLAGQDPAGADAVNLRARLDAVNQAAERLRAARRELLGGLGVDLSGRVPPGADAEDVSLVALAGLQDRLAKAEMRIERRNAFYHRIPGLSRFFSARRVTSRSIRSAVAAEVELRRLLDDGNGFDADRAGRDAQTAVDGFLAAGAPGQLDRLGRELAKLRHQLKLTGLASIERNVAKAFSCCLGPDGAAKPGSHTVTASFLGGAALKLLGLNAKIGGRVEFVSKVVIDDAGGATVTSARRYGFEASAGISWGRAADGAAPFGLNPGTIVDSRRGDFKDIAKAKGFDATLDLNALASLGFQRGHTRRYATVKEMIAANCTAMAVKMNGGRIALTDKKLRRMAVKADNAGFKRLLAEKGVLRRVDDFSARRMNKRVSDKVNVREYDVRANASAGLALPISTKAAGRAEFRFGVSSRQNVSYASVFDRREGPEDGRIDWLGVRAAFPPAGGRAPADAAEEFRTVLDALRAAYDDFQCAVAAHQSGEAAAPRPEVDYLGHLQRLGLADAGLDLAAAERRAGGADRLLGEALRAFADMAVATGRQFETVNWNARPQGAVMRLAAEKILARLKTDILQPTDFLVSRETLERALYTRTEGDRRRAVDVHFRTNAAAEFDVMGHRFGGDGIGRNRIPVVNPRAGAAVEFDVHAPFTQTDEDRGSFALTIGASNLTGLPQLVEYVAGAVDGNREHLSDKLKGLSSAALKALVSEEIKSALGTGVNVGLELLPSLLPTDAVKPLQTLLGGFGGISECDLAVRVKWIVSVDGSLHVDSVSVVHKSNVKTEFAVSLAEFGIPVYFGSSYQNVSEVELSGRMGAYSLYKPLHVRRGVNGRGNAWSAFVRRNAAAVDRMLRELRENRRYLDPGLDAGGNSSVTRQFRHYLSKTELWNRLDDAGRRGIVGRIGRLLDRAAARDLDDARRAETFGTLLDILNGRA